MSNYVRERTNQAAKLSIEGAIIQNVGGLYGDKLAKGSENQKPRSMQHSPRLSKRRIRNCLLFKRNSKQLKAAYRHAEAILLMIHDCLLTNREKVRGLMCRRLVGTRQLPRCVDRGKGREILVEKSTTKPIALACSKTRRSNESYRESTIGLSGRHKLQPRYLGNNRMVLTSSSSDPSNSE